MIGEIIGAGASILGGLLNKSSADKAREQQAQLAAQNIAAQREFAQNGVRWKADDARAAGIHPLFALGASTHSFSPVSVGSSADSSMGDAVASAGQNIGRAVQAGMTQEERSKSNVADALTLEKAGLENELLRTQIGALKQRQLGPAMPSLGPTPAGFPVKTDDIKQTPDTMPETARTRLFGIPLHTNPYFMDAETTENRYGNIAEGAQGIANLPADVAYTLYQRWPEISEWLNRGRLPVHAPKSNRPWIADQFKGRR